MDIVIVCSRHERAALRRLEFREYYARPSASAAIHLLEEYVGGSVPEGEDDQ